MNKKMIMNLYISTFVIDCKSLITNNVCQPHGWEASILIDNSNDIGIVIVNTASDIGSI